MFTLVKNIFFSPPPPPPKIDPPRKKYFIETAWQGIRNTFSRTTAYQALKIVPISESNYRSVVKTARLWNKIATEKQKKAEHWAKEAADQFYNCAFISSLIAGSLSPSMPCKVTICQDLAGREQGIMVVSAGLDAIQVDLLVTHPRNIASSLNADEKEKVKGAGGALLKHAETMARELNKKQVSLFPLEAAKPFYKKMGYRSDGGELMCKTVRKIPNLAAFLTSVTAA